MRVVHLLLAVFLVGVLASTPCLAAANAAGGKADAKASKEEGKDHKEEHSEQLNPFKGAVDLSIFTILNFIILFTLLRVFAWKPITEGLERREQSIAKDRYDAERAKHEADQLRSQLKAEMEKANEQIRQMMEKARLDAQSAAAEELARGKAELSAERERVQREPRISTDDALHKIWDQAAKLATVISTKVVRKQISYEDHRALLGEALNEFRAAAEARRENLESARA